MTAFQESFGLLAVALLAMAPATQAAGGPS